jgi:hypothetical protein
MTQPPTIENDDPDPSRQHPVVTTWPPEHAYPGGGYQPPGTFSPRPPGTYADASGRYARAALPARRKNRLALISMICGIAGLVLFVVDTCVPLLAGGGDWVFAVWGVGFLLGVAALITGLIARKQVKRSDRIEGGSRYAITGIVTGAVPTGFTCAAVVLFLLGLLFIAIYARAGGPM